MAPVGCHKALSYQLLIYGFQMVDISIVLGLFLGVAFMDSILLDIVYLIFAYRIAKKGRNRRQGYFISLIMFVYVIPPFAPLDRYRDIISYRNMMLKLDEKKD